MVSPNLVVLLIFSELGLARDECVCSQHSACVESKASIRSRQAKPDSAKYALQPLTTAGWPYTAIEGRTYVDVFSTARKRRL
jgi:hypothetical protein